MKNRDKYLKERSEYDIMLQMQENIGGGFNCCVIDEITGKIHNCPDKMLGRVGTYSRLTICKECIQKWLNEEAKSNE